MAEYSIGVDLGGTNLRAAAITREGKIVEKISVRTNPALGRESLLNEMVAAIDDLRSRWGTEKLAGIGGEKQSPLVENACSASCSFRPCAV